MTIDPSEDRPRPLFSRFYAKISPRMEAEGMADLRRELLAPMTGEVVEVGAGNGLNFAHYPPAVTRVIAVEPEPRLRQLAAEAARQATVAVTVTTGTVEQLPLPDHSVVIADATIWPLLTGGCHTATDPVGDIAAAGLVLAEVRGEAPPLS